jgi:hypothetical protein
VLGTQLLPLPGSVLKAVVFQLKDPDADIRYSALYALGGPTLPENALQEAVHQLLQMKEIDPDVRQEALYTLSSRSFHSARRYPSGGAIQTGGC